jgi:hypothetical protein
MKPWIKYTLGRIGLFVLVFVLLLPLPLNFFVSAMIALVVSFALSAFLLADWRNQMGEELASASSRRAAEKERLRAALAGDEDAAAAGDRAAAAGDRAAAAGERPAEPAVEAGFQPEVRPEPAAAAESEKTGADADRK